MAIIDTFLMIFKADTKSVKSGVDESEKDLKRLEAEAKKADAEVAKIGKSFLGVASSFKGLVAGFASAHAILSGFKSSMDYTGEISQLSKELQINEGDIDAWGRALQRTGGSVSSFKSVLQSLNQQYGGTPEQALRLLPRFADSFSKMSKTQALIRGKQFGFDVPTILLLQQGRREIDALIQKQKELGVVTHQDAVINDKFQISLREVGQAYNTFYRELSREITPKFTATFNYLLKHQDAIKGAFEGIAAAVGVLTLALIRANPYLALAATAIAGFGILKEDYLAYRSGKPSSLGDIKQSINPGVRHALKNTVQWNPADTFRTVKGGLTKAHQNLVNASSFLVPDGVKSVNLTTGDITINTNAKDSDEIAGALTGHLNKHLNQTVDQLGSGYAY